METIDEFGSRPAPKRPVFITVLCILTFVGCGLYFIGAIYGIITHEANKRAMELFSTGDNEVFGGFFKQMFSLTQEEIDNYFNWALWGHFTNLLNVATCLTGALLMWRLRRIGFYIYAVGIIPPMVTGIGLWTAVQSAPILNKGAIGGFVFTAIVSIAFVVMYGVNLKHMKRKDEITAQ